MAAWEMETTYTVAWRGVTRAGTMSVKSASQFDVFARSALISSLDDAVSNKRTLVDPLTYRVAANCLFEKSVKGTEAAPGQSCAAVISALAKRAKRRTNKTPRHMFKANKCAAARCGACVASSI